MNDDLFRTYRGSDPETSVESGVKAANESARSIAIVEAVMADGMTRTDEQIHMRAVSIGKVTSPDRIRHGRKWLADRGHLVATGERRRTSNGGTSRVWVKA